MNPSKHRLSRYGWRPADPPRRPVLFVNPRSGDGKAARAGLAERAREKGIEAVILAPGQDLAALAGEAVAGGADALGMAGGDGSLAVVATVAAGHGIPFVCVPAGTRNHFALDVGVDRHDVTGALDAFTAGVERQIDTAEVNGRVFLNNVSLGIYGDAVRSPAYRNAKVRTLLETAAQVMGPSGQAPALDLADDLGHEHAHPAIVLVSNNPYALDRQLARGTRPALDSGQLGILVLDAPGDRPRPPGRAWTAPRLEVNTPEPVHAGVDGEAVELSPPLRFAIRPAACGSGSPRATPAPRHQRSSTSRATYPRDSALPGSRHGLRGAPRAAVGYGPGGLWRRRQPVGLPAARPLPVAAYRRGEDGLAGFYHIQQRRCLLDTGVFDGDRYWIIEVVYAKADPG
jgi:diacylglycerol kinase family enzyme